MGSLPFLPLGLLAAGAAAGGADGWDEIDSIKAQIRGWSARTIPDTSFRHHRVEGIRDGSQRKRWHEEGKTAHYMGYRFSYLVARALWRARRQPVALALISGYVTAALGQRAAVS